MADDKADLRDLKERFLKGQFSHHRAASCHITSGVFSSL